MAAYVPQIILGVLGLIGVMSAAIYTAHTAKRRQEVEFAEERRLAEEKRIADEKAAAHKRDEEMRKMWLHMQPVINVNTNPSSYAPVHYDSSSHHNATASGGSAASSGSNSPPKVDSHNRGGGGYVKYLVAFFVLMILVAIVWSMASNPDASSADDKAVESAGPQNPTSQPVEPSSEPSDSSPPTAPTRDEQVNKFNQDLDRALDEHSEDKDLGVLREFYDFPLPRWYAARDVTAKRLAHEVWDGPNQGKVQYDPAVYVKTCFEDGSLLETENVVPYTDLAGPEQGKLQHARIVVDYKQSGSGGLRIKAVRDGHC